MSGSARTPLAALDAIEDELSAWGSRAGVYAAHISGYGTMVDLKLPRQRGPVPVASVCKLYVLGALLSSVDARRVSWSERLTVDAGIRSLGGGRLASLPDGTQVSVADAARLMIAASDNTATDLVMRRLGRPAVDAVLAEMGMGPASLGMSVPFLTTNELFKLKLHQGGLGRTYQHASVAERNAVLAELSKAPLAEPSAIPPGVQSLVEQVQWFATLPEIGAAFAWLFDRRRARHRDRLDSVFGRTSAVTIDGAIWSEYAYKGGDEPGVACRSWLLTRRDGERFVLVLALSDPARRMPGAGLVRVAKAAIAAIAAIGLDD